VRTVLASRIDAAEGLDECRDDYEPVEDLQVSADGTSIFASLSTGLFRVMPTALQITPDFNELFQLHPDGSVVIATATANRPGYSATYTSSNRQPTATYGTSGTSCSPAITTAPATTSALITAHTHRPTGLLHRRGCSRFLQHSDMLERVSVRWMPHFPPVLGL
jgi:hypothetical protein